MKVHERGYVVVVPHVVVADGSILWLTLTSSSSLRTDYKYQNITYLNQRSSQT